MDTLSHGAWGYVALHRLPPLAWWGVFAGAAPDLFWFVPSKIEQVAEKGWPALAIGREPGIWRADGPPLPPELVEAYFRYYVWTHSLVLLATVVGAVLLTRWRRLAWLGAPYALHILMDMPTHERYQTQPLYPLSSWSVRGLSWADPRIFWPHAVVLAVALGLVWWRRPTERRRLKADD
jgi:hypothetical protein